MDGILRDQVDFELVELVFGKFLSSQATFLILENKNQCLIASNDS